MLFGYCQIPRHNIICSLVKKLILLVFVSFSNVAYACLCMFCVFNGILHIFLKKFVILCGLIWVVSFCSLSLILAAPPSRDAWKLHHREAGERTREKEAKGNALLSWYFSFSIKPECINSADWLIPGPEKASGSDYNWAGSAVWF